MHSLQECSQRRLKQGQGESWRVACYSPVAFFISPNYLLIDDFKLRQDRRIKLKYNGYNAPEYWSVATDKILPWRTPVYLSEFCVKDEKRCENFYFTNQNIKTIKQIKQYFI